MLRRACDHEYDPDRIFRNTQKWTEALVCAFRQAGAGGRADYVDGDSYPSVVAVHASFWKYAGRICGHGTGKSGGAFPGADPVKLLF